MGIKENLKLILMSGALGVIGSLVSYAGNAGPIRVAGPIAPVVATTTAPIKTIVENIECINTSINTSYLVVINIPIGDKCLPKVNLNYEWKSLDDGSGSGWLGDVLPNKNLG